MNIAVNGRVLVLDAFELRRAGIAALICPWASSIGADILTLAPGDLVTTQMPLSPPILVISSVGGLSLHSTQALQLTEQLRRLNWHVPSLVLSDLTDPQEAVMAARLGHQAFLSTNVDPHFAVQACALVATGGTYFPREALEQIWGHSSPEEQRPPISQHLTARQLEVLEQLQLGNANKLIARHLSMQESTVKVHMREIMRKLGARNRTEAVMLARRKGLLRVTSYADE
jgi:DNA-binding NarL/FixJ family response regulator